LRATLEGHQGGVYAVAFGLDNRTLVSGSSDRTVRLWDGVLKSARDLYDGYADPVTALAISPDNRLLAVGTLGSLQLRPIEPLLPLTMRDFEDIVAALKRGTALEKQDKWKEAVEHYQKSIPLAVRLRGRRSEVTAILWDALAAASWKMGQISQAIAAYQQAIAIWENLAGKDNDLVLSLILLGNLYKEAGQLDQAAPLLERALKMRERKLGPDDPKTAQCQYTLAALYLAMARYAEAEKLLRLSLKTRESKLGAKDPATALSLGGLGFCYAAIGQPDRAESYYVRSVRILEDRLGPKAPNVGRAVNNLAFFYAGLGQLGRAETLFKQSLEILEGHYGRGHPATVFSLNNLAFLYLGMQKYDQAEPLL
jgi:tetratricopeptide (TPR) repeat protein